MDTQIDLSSLSERTRAIVLDVVDQIRRACPDDAERLLLAVRAVEPYAGDDEAVAGAWTDDRSPYSQEDMDSTGVVRVREDRPDVRLRLILAHEFGHAVTTDDDLFEQEAPSDEWSSECAANRYAHRWGFHEELKLFWDDADINHHGPPPGVECEEDGGRYIVSEEYICKWLDRPAWKIQ